MALERSKYRDAAERLESLHELEIRLFHEWLRESSRKGTLDAESVRVYGRRLIEGQKYQDKTANQRRLQETISQPQSGQVEAALTLLPSWTDREEIATAKSELSITCHAIIDYNSEDFIRAYAMLRAHFPPDELDPSVDMMAMLDDNKGRYPALATEGYKQLAPELSGPIHLRYYLVVAKDKDGNVIGATDGNFIGTTKSSSMYWAHIAVPGEQRRNGIATMLYAATLGLGNQYSSEAEVALSRTGGRVSYSAPTPEAPANKLMYFVVESEPANLESKEAVATTFGRLIFHGRATGASVIPLLLYAQVDLEYDRDRQFVQKDWNTVPLLLLVRRIGHEDETKIPVEEIRTIGDVLPTYFAASGLYNAGGLVYDGNYAVSRLVSTDSGTLQILQLPNAAGQTEQVEQLHRLVDILGTMDSRCRDLYPDHLWSKVYLARFAEAEREGRTFTVERAIKLMRDMARRKHDPTPTHA
jgi:hypothetical protein